jgi:hypothetical protein
MKLAQPSSAACDALRVIRTLRKHPSPQTPHAEKKVLKQLSVQDYIDVVLSLESEGQ